ncbi:MULTISPECIES: EAL domain-containing protein [unclassified Methylocaldum]|jgi:diguanylate cyclase (GGDEF)-like protein/PAS domain S-box-containing protein|uniref:bifunctional diguanylate cyclase/phosphodiesterase n=1 Tax=unclassified Methylocaldum TaxID=2622260 RepID=UPI000A3237CA|nr:EAL domain-containing protein [Methylocaldum sp. RMAD-M]MBP1151562.1 diguanylate cyclase (GGDEF)-like protein/PAS domain S-box-containing protein [Methylocaldum sp. RMAD-M]
MASVSRPKLTSGRLTYPLSLVIFAASYFLTAKSALLLATVHVKVTPIWPPTGLALAVCLAFGRRWWPGVFLGALAVNLTTGAWLSAFPIAVGNTLEAVAGAAWIARAVPSDRIFCTVRNVFRFLTFGVLAAPLISAGIGSLSVMLLEPNASRPICDLWWTWWLGNASGALVVAPLFLALAARSKLEALSLEQALHTVLTVLTGLYAFGGWLHPDTAHYPLVFLTIPTLIWAAFRFGPLAIASTLALNVLIAAASTANGIGPFSQYPTNASFLLLDAFILIVGGTTYVMSALVAEQKSTQSMLRNRGELLEQRVVESTRQLEQEREHLESILINMRDAVWSVSPDGEKVLFVNKVVENIYGHKPEEFYADPELWLNVVHPDDRPFVHAGFADLLQGANFDAVYRIVRADGEIRWVHDMGYPVTDAAGERTRLDGITRDITAEKRIETELRLAQAAFENTTEGIVITDAETRIVAVNRAFTAITGYPESDLLGKTPRLWQSKRHNGAVYKELWAAIRTTGQWRGELWNRRKNGEIFPALENVSAIRDRDGQILNYVAVVSDISGVKQFEKQLFQLAHHDVLTQLPNRLLFTDRVDHALSHAHREGHRVAVLFIDLDRFKNINDSLGHAVGDQLLCEIASRLTSAVHENDTVARLGGDEFAIAQEHIKTPACAAILAEVLVNALSEPVRVDEHDLFITPSIGISIYPDDAKGTDDLIRHADAAMYHAKRLGRNRFQFYSKSLTQEVLEKVRLETQLRQALKRGELEVFYQPQINLLDGTVSGAEALVRWRHPEIGLVSPTKFIPLAEESGIICQIGEFVLREACRQAKSWLDHGFSFQQIAVNVSSQQLHDSDLVELVSHTLAETGLDARYLEVEITETVVMQQTEKTLRILEDLRTLGVNLAVDDFGTGYSSLGYLKQLPVHRLKIDQSFVMDVPHENNDAIIRAIAAMARSLRLELIAEGVETAAQHAFLAAEGCQLGQGYLFGKSVPSSEFSFAPRPVPANAVDLSFLGT